MSKTDKLKAIAAEWWPDSLMVAGAASISYGAWCVYAPAGWIVAGLFAIAGGVILARDGKRGAV